MIKHTMNVKIDDEEIQAEYYEFDKPLVDTPYSLWDKITMPYYRVKSKIRDIYWDIRYGIQRMFKGYDYMDTFETFARFVDRYYRIITEYKRWHNGYPHNLTEEKWTDIINDMLRHLYYMDEENVEKELEKNVPENWVVDPKITSDIMERHKNEFFKLFSEYFYNLWD